MSNTDEKQAEMASEPRTWWLLAILAVVVTMWGANWWLLDGDTNRGTFGDMFGGINALFSGAAFSVLAYTLLLQRYELKLQRQELAETRKVMESQREQMELQAKTQQLQQFENTFFQLIKVHSDTVQAMQVHAAASGSAIGRPSFRLLVAALRDENTWAPGSTDLGKTIETYERFYDKHHAHVGHYFRHLYHIIKLVDEHPQFDRARYRSLLRAQLSTHEVTLLFYNCLSKHGANTKPLLVKYGMLKGLRDADLIDPAHVVFYDARAFMPTGPIRD